MRKATEITIRYSLPGDKSYVQDYKVGKKRVVPGYNHSEVVESITVVDSWKPHVEIEFEHFGTIWVLNYIKDIVFENEGYKEVLEARKEAKKNI